MVGGSPDYKVLYLEEQRRREEEQRRREEEQRRREEEQRRREEEQRRREAAENAQKEAEAAREEEQHRREEAEQAQERAVEKTRKTALPEFLDACHNHLHSGLTVQADPTLSTRGNPANANNKLRPERLALWADFPARQATIWDDLMESGFASERHFTSLHTLEETGEAVRRRMMSSELDLNVFQRHTVEDQVSLIIQGMHGDRRLRRKFALQGSVNFENHANTLSPESQLEEGMEQLTVSGTGRRQSPRLQAKAKAKGTGPSDPTGTAVAEEAGRKSTAGSSRPRADQFCVYNTGTTRSAQDRIAAFILEYKAPHKLPLSYIYEGLGEMELEEVVQCHEDETLRDRFRRLVAAVITQAFSYMIRIGVEYGCVCTGEAYIFLRVGDDPRTVNYFLSVPKGDVGETTGWTAGSESGNRLHLTAVGQMLAFTLQALKIPPRSQRWRTEAAAQLRSWEVVYDELLDAIPEGTTQSSEYQPPENDSFLRMSPVQLRGRGAKHSSPSCWQAEKRREASDEEPEPDPDTPSRQQSLSQHFSRTQKTAHSSSSGRRRGRRRGQGTEDGQYCTQECLRGLAKGGMLDRSCPNARDHGERYHQIDRPTFLALMRRQLADDLDTDCDPVSMPGACGVLFRVRLRSHGYAVAAKCTPAYFVHRLRREASIYERLRPIQGIHVPVHLGNIDLETPYFYEGIVELVHMMFLSFGGNPISQHLTAKNKALVSEQVKLSADAIHGLRVLHKDLMPRNILWNEETKRVMVIDFERAEVEHRTVLGVVSANRKRKRPTDSSGKQGQTKPSACTQEIRRAMFELNGMAQSIRCR
jgi:hypothetical protein